jgi:hypothetical protein
VVPDTVHTDVVADVKATARPEVAVADRVAVDPMVTGLAGCVKLIV